MVKAEYDEFWKAALFLIKDGVLTFDEACRLDADELYEIYYANMLFNEEQKKIMEEEMRKAGEEVDGGY